MSLDNKLTYREQKIRDLKRIAYGSVVAAVLTYGLTDAYREKSDYKLNHLMYEAFVLDGESEILQNKADSILNLDLDNDSRRSLLLKTSKELKYIKNEVKKTIGRVEEIKSSTDYQVGLWGKWLPVAMLGIGALSYRHARKREKEYS